MAVRPASVVFALLVATAVGISVWMVFQRPGSEPAPLPAPGAGGGGTPSAPAPGSGPTPPDATAKKGPKTVRPRPKSPPPEPVDPVPATREGCLAFLRQQASPVTPGKGAKGSPVWSDLRTEAMDALVLVDPAAAEPLVLQALGGDGDPSDWCDERMHAAGIRIRAGKPDGAETVKALIKSGEDLDFVAIETARAASWLPPADGGPVVRRMLAVKPEDYAEDDLVAILQAAASLGQGATVEQLRPLATPGPDGNVDASVRGAAAGALLRLGDGSGKGFLKDLDETDAADVARGLGARGNEAAIPLLEELLRSEDGDVRAGAARSLGDVGGAKAMEGLRRALKDPEEDVRAWAAVGLAGLGARDGVAEIRKAAAGKDVWLAVAAWKALATVGDAESRDAAARVLAGEVKRVPPLDRHTELMLRIWAAAVVVRTAK